MNITEKQLKEVLYVAASRALTYRDYYADEEDAIKRAAREAADKILGVQVKYDPAG